MTAPWPALTTERFIRAGLHNRTTNLQALAEEVWQAIHKLRNQAYFSTPALQASRNTLRRCAEVESYPSLRRVARGYLRRTRHAT